MPVVADDATIDLARLTDRLPASVTATRTSESDVKMRQLIVWIDGERIATLLWGDSITRELEPGPHRLRVSNTLFWKTVEFVLAPGEQAYFEVINRNGPGSVLMPMFVGAGPLYVTIRPMS
jgi:hypothetical protein